MKALYAHAARDLRLSTCDAGEPGPGEVRVRLARGGICGSDLHYYQHGGFGTVRLKEPMILGHEVSGHVDTVGDGVEGLTPGDLVAVSPSRPCGACEQCPARPAQPLPEHALLRLCHALSRIFRAPFAR